MKSKFPLLQEVILGRYRILHESDTDSNFRNYKARDNKTGEFVALKVILPSESAAESHISIIQKEASLLLGSNYPNIVKVVDFAIEDGRIIVVSEFLEGHSLFSAVARHGAFSPDYVITIAKSVLPTLARIHEDGLIHENINPTNILIDKLGSVWLADILSSHNYSITGANTPKNTGLPYVAPEGFSDKDTDSRWDLYSLGVSLYYALVASIPQELNTMFASGIKDGIDPRSLDLTIPEGLALTIKRATKSNPIDRFPTAEYFLDIILADEKTRLYLSSKIPSTFSCMSCDQEVMLSRGVCKKCELSSTDPRTIYVFVKPNKWGLKIHSVSKKIQKLINLEKITEEVNEVSRGDRPLICCSMGIANSIINRMKKNDLNSKITYANNLFANISKDILILLFFIVLLSILAQIRIGSGFLLPGFLVSLSLLFFGYQFGNESLIESIKGNSYIPNKTAKRLEDQIAEIKSSSLRTLLAREAMISEDIYKRFNSLSFQVSQLLMFNCDAIDKIKKIDQSIEALNNLAKDDKAYSIEIVQIKRARSKAVLGVLKTYEILSRLLLTPAAADDKDLSVDFKQRVEKLIKNREINTD